MYLVSKIPLHIFIRARENHNWFLNFTFFFSENTFFTTFPCQRSMQFKQIVLKKGEIYLHTYQDSKEARRAIFEYIEGWYNRKRIDNAIGYITPQQKEDEKLKKVA